MSPEIALYITKYGYLAIFLLVFLQEIGVPSPVPNELVLLFSGYLASIGTMSFPLVFLTVALADFLGTTLLYFVFYFFGTYLFRKKPSWLPISREKIEKLTESALKRGALGIYVGRLIPYVRGYTSVAAGLLRIKPRIFLTAVIFSAITWSGGYAVAGKLFGPYWQNLAEKIGSIQSILLFLALVIVIIFVGKYFRRRKLNRSTN